MFSLSFTLLLDSVIWADFSHEPLTNYVNLDKLLNFAVTIFPSSIKYS